MTESLEPHAAESGQRKKEGWLRRLYNWVVRNADKPHASWTLGIVSFAESSIFPIPPDALLLPMAAANPKKIWFYAHLCIITSVLGGIVGYYIGIALYETLGLWIVNLYGVGDDVEQLRTSYNDGYGMLVLITKGLTPIPYKIVTIVSGLTEFPFYEFIIGSIIARSTRFYMLAILLTYFGEPVRLWVEKHLGLAAIILVGAIIFTFVAVTWFF